MTTYLRQDLIDGLTRLGLVKGDMVLVRAALRAMGDLQKKRSSEFLNALIDVVGSDGTIIGLAFNKLSFFPNRRKDYIITSKTMLKYYLTKMPNIIRWLWKSLRSSTK